ncbi:MAG: hypothetical protein GWP08_13125 [Nitrospiraceae bacterium]|nr:hypothetical protein [Nitrospiraceae bacterium]
MIYTDICWTLLCAGHFTLCATLFEFLWFNEDDPGFLFIIAENHGGEMSVGSAPGEGTTFIISRPV